MAHLLVRPGRRKWARVRIPLRVHGRPRLEHWPSGAIVDSLCTDGALCASFRIHSHWGAEAEHGGASMGTTTQVRPPRGCMSLDKPLNPSEPQKSPF